VLAVFVMSATVSAVSVFTLQQTVLSAGFVTDAAEEAGAYETIEAELVNETTEEIQATETEEIPTTAIDAEAIADEAITEPYIRTQSEQVITAGAAYLNGDREELVLPVNTEPLIESASAAVGTAVRNVDLTALVEDLGAEQIGAVAGTDVPIDGDALARMRDGPQEYGAVGKQFQAELRGTAVDRIIEARSSVELLALIGVDPPDGQQDRERLVEQKEDQIRTAVVEQPEFESEFDQQLETVREETANMIESETRRVTAEYEATIAEPAVELQLAVLDGLVTDQSYERFTERVEGARAAIADEAERIARTEITAALDTERDLADELSAEDRDQVDELANFVQLSELAGVGLLGAIGLAGGLAYGISRSIATTASTVGGGLASGGAIATIVATQDQRAIGQIEMEFAGETGARAETVEAFAIAIVEGVSGQLSAYGLPAVALGAGLLGAVLLRRYVFDRTQPTTTDSAETTDSIEATDGLDTGEED
jgi:hypothetical protein